MKRKIVLIGAGSRYFETVIGELATTPALAGCSVTLFDIDRKRMELIRQAGRRIIEGAKAKLTLTATTSLAKALDGADYAISSIGVHGPGARWHRLDSEVCARFGIMHTTGDTVGPSGISQGLRIIPIYLKIANAMTKYCPDAILLNHSNPMNPICRAIIKATGINVIGYCHNIAGGIRYWAKMLDVPHEELETAVAGPNHMSWLLEIRHKGRNVLPELKRRILQSKPEPTVMFAKELLQMLDVVPVIHDRHMIEFFPHAREARRPKELKYAMQWRVDMIDQQRLAKEISKAPDELELRAKGLKPPRIPAKPSPESMGEQICAMALNKEKVHYVNTPNRGAVPNLPDWAVIDLKAIIGSHGARPIYVGNLPAQAARWSLPTIYAQELLVDAAIEGSRKKTLMALACDPMILNFTEVEPLFDAIVQAQGDRMATFKKRAPSTRRRR